MVGLCDHINCCMDIIFSRGQLLFIVSGLLLYLRPVCLPVTSASRYESKKLNNTANNLLMVDYRCVFMTRCLTNLPLNYFFAVWQSTSAPSSASSRTALLLSTHNNTTMQSWTRRRIKDLRAHALLNYKYSFYIYFVSEGTGIALSSVS